MVKNMTPVAPHNPRTAHLLRAKTSSRDCAPTAHRKNQSAAHRPPAHNPRIKKKQPAASAAQRIALYRAPAARRTCSSLRLDRYDLVCGLTW